MCPLSHFCDEVGVSAVMSSTALQGAAQMFAGSLDTYCKACFGKLVMTVQHSGRYPCLTSFMKMLGALVFVFTKCSKLTNFLLRTCLLLHQQAFAGE
jgi:hypothetical protein